MSLIKLSLPVAERTLRATMPLIGVSLATLEQNGGRTYLAKGLVDRLHAFSVPRWAELYPDPKKHLLVSLLGIYTPTQLEDIGRHLSGASDEERTKFWDSLVEYVSTRNWMDDEIDEYLDNVPTEEILEELKEVLEMGGDKLKTEVAHYLVASYTSVTLSFYNSLAMMAYGATMSDLVGRAIQGDLPSYYKAYHVDQTVADIPYFVALHNKKKDDLKSDFFAALSQRRRTPLIPKKLQYPKLWYAFGLFDSFGLLPSRAGGGFSLERLLNLFIELKIYGFNHDRGVDDLSKRLQDYREQQRKLKARKFTK